MRTTQLKEALSTGCSLIRLNLVRAFGTVFLFTILPNTQLFAANYYVSPTGSETSPFSSWATAARTIQSAITAAGNNGIVYVTNGTYFLSSELVLNKKITLQSANGPNVTIIDGSNTVRCLNVSSNAGVSGFTIANGLAANGGGVYFSGSGGLTNCIITGNSTTDNGSGVTNGFGGGIYLDKGGMVSNCTIMCNTSSLDGAGIYALSGTVNRCTISGNRTVGVDEPRAYGGAGIYVCKGGVVLNSTISDNTTDFDGGGVYLDSGGSVSSCTIVANHSGGDGAGVYLFQGGTVLSSTIRNNACLGYWSFNGCGGGVYALDGGLVKACEIYDNETLSGGQYQGGGAYLYGTNSILQNCAIYGNRSSCNGGGVYLRNGILRNCTITYNHVFNGVDFFGGGIYGVSGTVDNTIIYYNTADIFDDNFIGGAVTFANCCTVPAPLSGSGHITNTPLFVSISRDCHLSNTSPCINAGITRAYNNSETDIDGQQRTNGVVDIGADEYTFNASITANTIITGGPFTVLVGSNLTLNAKQLSGTYRWDFGDGIASDWSSSGTVQHSYSATGNFTATLLVRADSGQATTNTSVTVLESPPTLTFSSSNYTGFPGDNIAFDVTATYLDWPDFQFLFEVDGASSGWNTTPSYSHTFAAPTSTTLRVLCQRMTSPPDVTPTGPIATSTVAVTIYDATPSLTVITPIGNAAPPVGTNLFTFGTNLNCILTDSPVSLGGTQYVGNGGAVLGNAYTVVNPTNINLTLNSDAELSWAWRTNFWLGINLNGLGGVNQTNGWRALGSNVAITATASNHWKFANWSGTTSGCTIAANVITAAMNQARNITANFISDTNRLIVKSIWGVTYPPIGTNIFDYGTTLNCIVSNSPVILGGTQYVGSGFTVLSNSFTSNSVTNITLTLTNNAVLTWLWTTQYLLTATASTGGSITSPTSKWNNAGTVTSVTSAPAAYYVFTNWSGDTQGATNTTRCTVTNNRSRSITANFAALVVTNSTPCWWLAEHGLTTNSATALLDSDSDRITNWAEYVANTDPTNNSSLPALTQGPRLTAPGMLIHWQGGSNRWVDILYTTNLSTPYTTLTSNLFSTADFNVYTDQTAVGISPKFYRIIFDTKP